MSAKVLSVRHAGIAVSDLDASLRFYRDLLHLSVRVQAVESGVFLDTILGFAEARVTTVKLGTPEGPTLIELLHYENPPFHDISGRDVNAIGPSHVALTVSALDDLYRELVEAGVVFRSPPAVSPDGKAKVAFCSDPDNTPIELVEVLSK